jgi:hypothetical protein
MSQTLHGIMQSDSIQLSERSTIPPGTKVQILVMPELPARENLVPGEGLRRAFGAWAEDDAELDEFLDWCRQQRKIERRSVDP